MGVGEATMSASRLFLLALLAAGVVLYCAEAKEHCTVSTVEYEGPSNKCSYKKKFCLDGTDHVRLGSNSDMCNPVGSSTIGLTGCDDCDASELTECWKFIAKKAYDLEVRSIGYTKAMRQKSINHKDFEEQCIKEEARSSAELGEVAGDFAGGACDWKPGTKHKYMGGSYANGECPMQLKLCKDTEKLIYGATNERWTVSVRHVQMDKNHDLYEGSVSSRCHGMLLDYSEHLEGFAANSAKNSRITTIENAQPPDDYKEEDKEEDDDDDSDEVVSSVTAILNSGSTTYNSGSTTYNSGSTTYGSGMSGSSGMTAGSLHYGDASEQAESYFTASEYDDAKK